MAAAAGCSLITLCQSFLLPSDVSNQKDGTLCCQWMSCEGMYQPTCLLSLARIDFMLRSNILLNALSMFKFSWILVSKWIS